MDHSMPSKMVAWSRIRCPSKHTEPMVKESWANSDRYILARATPLATESPRLTLTAWAST